VAVDAAAVVVAMAIVKRNELISLIVVLLWLLQAVSCQITRRKDEWRTGSRSELESERERLAGVDSDRT
jgi:hypothetical protein